ncbi:class I adenylate-forming enzyme family protein [Microbacterium sp. A84]|uniref:class I adenylate-forming enzyme family protein n=1 Tax=Microbacterium sp. A84 TaxID=3450715 RepID=UPI003F4222D7
MNTNDISIGDATANDVSHALLSGLLEDLAFDDSSLLVASPKHRLSLREVRERVSALSGALTAAGAKQGMAIGVHVEESARAVIAMFAIWSSGGVYVPINGRATQEEIASVISETPVALLIGSAGERSDRAGGIGYVQFADNLEPRIIAHADQSQELYEPDIALALRTSGTTGRPKAVLLRHSGTIGALDSSLRMLRRTAKSPIDSPGSLRMNVVPTSLSLWAGIYNTVFSFRAGIGVALMDKFNVDLFVEIVREFQVKSTVLAPAMIAMLADDPNLTDLAPLRLVRSITAPLSPTIARDFYERFDVFVLNSYGQTELGGEVVGWTSADVRDFGVDKLGAAGRPYPDVALEVRGPDGEKVGIDRPGEIFVNSPYRMQGYAKSSSAVPEDVDRFVGGYLRTGDIGRLDADGFLWIEGRVSDMINRGGLKVFPAEVEEVLRRHPGVRDAAVAGVPDRRLGEVPHAWIISESADITDRLADWCREHLVPYKIPAGFTRVDAFPRNEIGKVLRGQLIQASD